MSEAFKPGHIVHVDHLHGKPQGPDLKGNYLIEGKGRYMIVVGAKPRLMKQTAVNTGDRVNREGDTCCLYRVKGEQGYLVVALQSKKPHGSDTHMPIRSPLPNLATSYVDLRPFWYPDVTIKDEQMDVDPLIFNVIHKEMTWRKLGYPGE